MGINEATLETRPTRNGYARHLGNRAGFTTLVCAMLAQYNLSHSPLDKPPPYVHFPFHQTLLSDLLCCHYRSLIRFLSYYHYQLVDFLHCHHSLKHVLRPANYHASLYIKSFTIITFNKKDLFSEMK